MTDEVLLPCPFCGKPTSIIVTVDIDRSTGYHVGCTNARCSVEPEVGDRDKSEAIRLWNTRF